MTDCLCESCHCWHVHDDMHADCSKGLLKSPDEWKSCQEGCGGYDWLGNYDGRIKDVLLSGRQIGHTMGSTYALQKLASRLTHEKGKPK